MANYRVFSRVSGWNRDKTINLLMKEMYDEGSYHTIHFGVRSGDNSQADIKKIQNEMDTEVLEFLEEKSAVGYQLVPFSHGQVCIHVLYSWADEDEDYGNVKELS